MSLPEDFLTQLAQEHELSPRQRDIFIQLFGRRITRQAIEMDLHISEGSLNRYLTGIYQKFSINSDQGCGKEHHLREHLNQRYKIWQNSNPPNPITIDTLVQQIREKVRPYIQDKCGIMRILDMTQPIELSQIYTDVNILENITGRRGIDYREFIQIVNSKNFDRFGLGGIVEKRVPGLEAVEKFTKLMILGKPGAGKTTFLKHLAIQCIEGNFQKHKIPFFITLKDFADTRQNPDLLEYIIASIKTSKEDLQIILEKGRALILLDGLDEVRKADSSRVLKQIEEFYRQFSINQFVITCRIAYKEYTFEPFTEVEIADFDDEQVTDFSNKWFRRKNDLVKAEKFIQKLKENEPIRELAINPLLLTLLCLVFEDSGNFPTNRADLYHKGIKVLLEKWDVTRNIERDQIYRQLSSKRKEDLLSYIASTTFKTGSYFVKQREIENYINHYIQNLPGASNDPDILDLDSTAILKSIEAQHGLLIERARGIYSFSHLTFHEYFTALKIVTSCNPYSIDDAILQELVSHITEKRWREVFLLVTERLDNADALLRLMKGKIDEFLVGDRDLQQFLEWVNEKANLVETPYKLAAVRAFYLYRADRTTRGYPYEWISFDELAPELRLDYYLFKVLYSLFYQPDAYDYEYVGDYEIYLDRKIDSLLANDLQIMFECSGYRFIREFVEHLESNQSLVLHNPDESLEMAIDIAEQLNLGELKRVLEELFSINRICWLEKLSNLMIDYRNIGHTLSFSQLQKDLLKQYNNANNLLIDCLNSDCYVSREVRQEIEDTLLLPIKEIEKRKLIK